MIVVTGGAGFVGSNIVGRLGADGHDVTVVDDLADPRKLPNVLHAPITDVVDLDDFLVLLREDSALLRDVTAVVHQGACSSTTESDVRLVMRRNHEYSREVVRWCLRAGVPLVYASSAAVYGASTAFSEDDANERPANLYGWSKLLTDRFVRRALPTATSQVVGLRYFNVYGPGEAHKDEMASIVAQLHRELLSDGTATIFGASHGLAAGQQRRDFVSVHDVVDVVAWFLDHPDRSGVFNVGTGECPTFAEVAELVVASHGSGRVVHRPFPPELVDRYQPYTRADLTRLRGAGYLEAFTPVTDGVPAYVRALDA